MKQIDPIMILAPEPNAFGATKHTAIQWHDPNGNYHLGWIPTELLAILVATDRVRVERLYDEARDWRPYTGVNVFGHACPRGSRADVGILRLPEMTEK